MDKRFALILVVVVALIGGIFVLSKDKKSPNSSNSSSSAGTSNHSEGTGTTGVELVEYGDLQCPACGQFFPIVEQITEKYGDQIKFTYKNFPLDSIHPNARAAHRAAEAAGIQGKFFEMYRLMYQNQTNWASLGNPVTVFDDYATQLGLNLEKFKTDFSSEAVNSTINADVKEGKDKYQANSTPTFVIDGQKVSNTELGSLDLFTKKIDEAIAAKAASNPTPITPTP